MVVELLPQVASLKGAGWADGRKLERVKEGGKLAKKHWKKQWSEGVEERGRGKTLIGAEKYRVILARKGVRIMNSETPSPDYLNGGAEIYG